MQNNIQLLDTIIYAMYVPVKVDEKRQKYLNQRKSNANFTLIFK